MWQMWGTLTHHWNCRINPAAKLYKVVPLCFQLQLQTSRVSTTHLNLPDLSPDQGETRRLSEAKRRSLFFCTHVVSVLWWTINLLKLLEFFSLIIDNIQAVTAVPVPEQVYTTPQSLIQFMPPVLLQVCDDTTASDSDPPLPSVDDSDVVSDIFPWLVNNKASSSLLKVEHRSLCSSSQQRVPSWPLAVLRFLQWWAVPVLQILALVTVTWWCRLSLLHLFDFKPL